ncbi:MAG: replication-relaxation family protein [Candidatus Sedimenticola sp. (ex Thyasira tokunagai)]
MMISLSENDNKALFSLASYQYLTASQMERLGVGKNRKTIRDYTLRRLTRIRPALVGAQDFGMIPGVGRLEVVYFLTEHGAQIVAEQLRCDVSELVYPKHGIRYQDDYFHRIHHVNFHISLRQWVDQRPGAELEFFNSYYTKTKGKKIRSVNQVYFKPNPSLPMHYRKTIEPDGIFRFTASGKSFLCAMEIHRKPDSKYITKQLDTHMTALDQSLLAEQYDHPADNLVLSVHESVSSFKSVQRRLMDNPEFEKFLPFFHFNLTEYAGADLQGHWITADGKNSSLFAE